MKRGNFSLGSLPAWCALNGVSFHNIEISELQGRGYGLVSKRDVSADNTDDESTILLRVPKDLILCAETIEGYAKENKAFAKLLDAVGRQSTRSDILLFLLMQRVLSSPDYSGNLGAPIPWSQYFALLPTQVPLPTMWSEDELSSLSGTSLEPAIVAKLQVLTKEFDHIKEATSAMSPWDELLSVQESLTVHDWLWLDALYRSRSLELPQSGESMVPCLDMANHSSDFQATFEEEKSGGAGGVVLALRDATSVASGSEININYGQKKSAAEMLFSYGFIDPGSAVQSLVLPLRLMDDDPLAKAKLHVYGQSPTLKLHRDDAGGEAKWEGPFLYMMCVNEEDGLEFKVLQENDGTRHLRMFWQDDDVTDRSDQFEHLVSEHELYPIIRLRAISIVLEMAGEQLEALAACEADLSPGPVHGDDVRPETLQAAAQLREIESELLTSVSRVLEQQRTTLLGHDVVTAYLASVAGGDPLGDEPVEDDFS